MKKQILIFFLAILFISFTSAGVTYDDCEIYGNCKPVSSITEGANYSINVNNTNYLQGYTPTTLKDWIQGLFNSIFLLKSEWNSTNTSYVPYTGANQNVNLGNNNLTVNGTTLFVDTNNSRVGIGTTTPGAKLEILGSSSAPSLRVDDFVQQSYSNAVSSISNNLYYNNGYKYLESGVAGQSLAMDKGSFMFYYSNATGNGIDLNASPKILLNLSADGDLHLKSKASTRIYGWNNNYIELYNSSTGGFNFYSLNGAAESVFFGALRTTGGLTVGGTFRPGSLTIGTSDGKISGGSNYLDNAYIQMYEGGTGNFDFSTGKRLPTTSYRWYTNQTQLKMTLLYNGNLGIGTSNPLTTLHSNGNILANGTINATSDIETNGNLKVNKNVNITGNISVKRPYGMFSSTEDQNITSANTPFPITFNWTEDAYQLSIENSENFTFQDSGDYLMELSAIVVTDTNNKHVSIWVQKNGINVARSNTRIEIENAGTEQIIAVPFILDVDATTDKFRFMMASDDAGSMLVHTANTSYSPDSPSVIVTMTKVSEVT